ncbi:nucleotide-binding universal stress UspA family protein [Streptomyces canus]|uniref:universal stress protein n=1 Tax=Streptomyces sp. RP5T TaxID=2490848 RepID=UPI000F653E5C|nr:universal stress protein [Streptomyces sp. RP5T]RRR86844.1 universal stress protein [Streptomyces sp. RP5T]
MELPLVVGVDGSDSSLRAVDWAVDEAARHGLPLRLLHAFRWERYERTLPSFTTGRHAGEVMAQNIVASCAHRAGLRDPEVKVAEEAVPDDAVPALLRAAPDAFALVVGERGRGEVAGLLLGSVSLAVAARAVCPVVVVRGEEPNLRGSLGRVVVGVGEVADSAGAVRFAAREAQARGCALTAVRAWRRPAREQGDDPLVADDTRAGSELEDALRDAVREHPDLSVHRHTVEGPAHRALLDAAADADLVVVGAVRGHGHFGLQLGRAAHTLLHHSACPVAVVPRRV